MTSNLKGLEKPRWDFYHQRDELITTNQVFGPSNLSKISYAELPLCCIATAGAAMGLVAEVRAEKRERRVPFLELEDDELDAFKTALNLEGMWDDVMAFRQQRYVPHWDSLFNRQKIWFKLNCVYNHVDQPNQRIGEALLLLRRCAEEVNSGLPKDVCAHYSHRLRNLYEFPTHMDAIAFREKISDLADTLLEFLPEAERSICDREHVKGFRCTSDCFRLFC